MKDFPAPWKFEMWIGLLKGIIVACCKKWERKKTPFIFCSYFWFFSWFSSAHDFEISYYY